MAPAPSWTGFYIGANAGFTASNSDFSGSVPCWAACNYFAPVNAAIINGAPAGRGTGTDFTGGFQAGYNWQSGTYFFGFEAD